MLRFVAPAGAPVRISQILRSVRGLFSHDGKAEETIQALAGALNARHVFAISSGRAALSLILKSLLRLRPDHSVVALPAYTCFTVPAAIVRAGLKLHPVDIDPMTLDFNFAQLSALPNEKTLCVLTSNLFGLVNNAARVREIARAHGAFVVDDAAQALGSTLHGLRAGLLGDVGFYSFGRGKALAAIEGGLIVTNSDEIAAAMAEEGSDLPRASAGHSAGLFLQLLVYAVFLRPRLYWIPNSLPFLKLGATEFDPNFPSHQLPALLGELLPQLMEQLERINRIRRENAAALTSALEGNPAFTVPRPAEGCSPNYIRFPLIACDQTRRDRAVKALRSVGIGAGPFYPGAVCDIEGISPSMALHDFHCPVAENLSRRLLTLPTHMFVTPSDLQRIIESLRRVAGG